MAYQPNEKIPRIMVATPLGTDGRGGIDRLNDAIFRTLDGRSDHQVKVTKIVTRGQGSLAEAQFVFLRSVIMFASIVLFRRVDLLHIHLSVNGSAYRKVTIGLLAYILRVPYVVHLHGCNFGEFWSGTNAILAKGIRRLLLNSRATVVLGKVVAREISVRLPMMENRIYVLPNASVPSQLPQVPSPDGKVRLTFLGRLGPRKGTQIFLEALKQLSSRHDWCATIAGDGEVEEFRARVAEAGLSALIEVPGWLSALDTERLLSHTDVLVLPSFSENLPMVIIEAFAHGVPAISTNVAAIPEVVQDGRTGLIVPTGDPNALAFAIVRLIVDSDFRLQLADAAKREHAERYELDGYVDRLVELWHRCLKPEGRVASASANLAR